MLTIIPELLSHSGASPYPNALERGYRWLRFEGPLEQEFKAFYTDGHLLRVRLAACLVIVLFAAFIAIDMATLPAAASFWTTKIRVFNILPAAWLLFVSDRQSSRGQVRRVLYGACFVAGLGTVAIIGTTLAMRTQIPYEGILLVTPTLFTYLIACLQ